MKKEKDLKRKKRNPNKKNLKKNLKRLKNHLLKKKLKILKSMKESNALNAKPLLLLELDMLVLNVQLIFAQHVKKISNINMIY